MRSAPQLGRPYQARKAICEGRQMRAVDDGRVQDVPVAVRERPCGAGIAISESNRRQRGDEDPRLVVVLLLE